MEFLYVILAVTILCKLSDVNDKLKKLLTQEKQNKLDFSDCLNKDVYIILNNDNVTDSYLFTSIMKTMGKILDYDDHWFVFRYYDKNKKQNVTRYLRTSDLLSINEIMMD